MKPFVVLIGPLAAMAVASGASAQSTATAHSVSGSRVICAFDQGANRSSGAYEDSRADPPEDSGPRPLELPAASLKDIGTSRAVNTRERCVGRTFDEHLEGTSGEGASPDRSRSDDGPPR